MASTVLGIDISKRDFHVSLLTETRATKPKKFTNNTQGFESLHNWLQQQNVVELHACRSATSIYGEALAEFFYGAGFQGEHNSYAISIYTEDNLSCCFEY